MLSLKSHSFELLNLYRHKSIRVLWSFNKPKLLIELNRHFAWTHTNKVSLFVLNHSKNPLHHSTSHTLPLILRYNNRILNIAIHPSIPTHANHSNYFSIVIRTHAIRGSAERLLSPLISNTPRCQDPISSIPQLF